MPNNSKHEIETILNDFKISIDKTTNNSELLYILSNLRKCKSHEKPDAFFETENYIYGIEHFQVSQYEDKKNQDVSRIAEGSKQKRDKIKGSGEFNLHPSINNLINSINRCLNSHSKSFQSYEDNIKNKFDDKNYRLVIFIEDRTNSEYIVKKNSSDLKFINPLLLKQIAEIILEFKDFIFAIIYSYGNEVDKTITGLTLEELEKKLNSGDLLDSKDYSPLEQERTVKVAKDEKDDENNITIKLVDRL